MAELSELENVAAEVLYRFQFDKKSLPRDRAATPPSKASNSKASKAETPATNFDNASPFPNFDNASPFPNFDNASPFPRITRPITARKAEQDAKARNSNDFSSPNRNAFNNDHPSTTPGVSNGDIYSVPASVPRHVEAAENTGDTGSAAAGSDTASSSGPTPKKKKTFIRVIQSGLPARKDRFQPYYKGGIVPSELQPKKKIHIKVIHSGLPARKDRFQPYYKGGIVPSELQPKKKIHIKVIHSGLPARKDPVQPYYKGGIVPSELKPKKKTHIKVIHSGLPPRKDRFQPYHKGGIVPSELQPKKKTHIKVIHSGLPARKDRFQPYYKGGIVPGDVQPTPASIKLESTPVPDKTNFWTPVDNNKRNASDVKAEEEESPANMPETTLRRSTRKRTATFKKQ